MDFELSAGILAAGPAQPAYSPDPTAKADLRRRIAARWPTLASAERLQRAPGRFTGLARKALLP